MPAAMSAVEGRADFGCQELSGPFLAEGVEEVTRVRILETMVQCRGQRRINIAPHSADGNERVKKFDSSDFFDSLG